MDPKLTNRNKTPPNDSAAFEPNSFDRSRWIRGLHVPDEISRSQKLMLFTLESYADLATGECYPSQKTLAAACGCSTRTVIEDLRALEQAGYIERIRRNAPAAAGDRRRSLYRIKYPQLAASTSGNTQPAAYENPQPAADGYTQPAAVEQDRETSHKNKPGKSLSQSPSSSRNASARPRARRNGKKLTAKEQIEAGRERRRQKAQADPSRSSGPKDGEGSATPASDHQASRNTRPTAHISDGVPEWVEHATPCELRQRASWTQLDAWGFDFSKGVLVRQPDWYRGTEALAATNGRAA